MRRSAALVVLLLAACAAPSGVRPDPCGGAWLTVDEVIVDPGPGDEQPLAIDCISTMSERRIEVGFTMPAGPTCYRLSRIELVESADAASVTLFVRPDENPAAGACSSEPMQLVTEIDLQSPVDGRTLLDGGG